MRPSPRTVKFASLLPAVVLLALGPHAAWAIAAPANLAGKPLASTIGLKWDLVSGATGYNVYRAIVEDPQQPPPTSDYAAVTVRPLPHPLNVYRDAGVTDGLTYAYYVTAVDAGGESGASNTVNVTAGAPSFKAIPFPPAEPGTANVTARFLLVIQGLNGFADTLNLAADNWPAGFTPTITPATVTLSSTTATVAATVQAAVDSSAPTGQVSRLPVKVTPQSSANASLAETINFSVYVLASTQQGIVVFTAPRLELDHTIYAFGRILPPPGADTAVTVTLTKPDTTTVALSSTANADGWFYTDRVADAVGDWTAEAAAGSLISPKWPFKVFESYTFTTVYYAPTSGDTSNTTGTLSGQVVPTPTDGAGTTVTLTFKGPAGVQIGQKTTQLASDGKYSYAFTMADFVGGTKGKWRVLVRWAGTAAYAPSANLAVFPVGEKIGKAVIVVGDSSGDSTNDTIRKTYADTAYATLAARGYPSSEVVYLQPSSGTVTLSAVQSAISQAVGAASTNWYAPIYLIGPEDGSGGMRLNTTGEALLPSTLAGYVGTTKTLFIIDADKSGQFISSLLSPGQQVPVRITLTSAQATEAAPLTTGYSPMFWTGIAKNVTAGLSGLLAREAVKIASVGAQNPQIAVYGKNTLIDAAVASLVYLGYPSAEWTISPEILDAPEVLAKAFQSLLGAAGARRGNDYTLRVRPRKGTRAEVNIIAVLVGLVTDRSAGSPEVQRVTLTDPDGDGVYSGTVTAPGTGTYTVGIYAEDSQGNRSETAKTLLVNEDLAVPATGPWGILALVLGFGLLVALGARSIGGRRGGGRP